MTRPLHGQAYAGCLPIWQGFSLQWQYPHSLARFGSHLKQVENSGSGNGCPVKQIVFATPGNGADSAKTVGYHALVNAGLLHSRAGNLTLSLAGKEKEVLHVTEVADVSLPELLEEDFNWEVVLAGFELRTAEGTQADQIQALDVGIDSVWRDGKEQKLKFRVDAGLQMACPTMDCEPLNQIVEYELVVYWQVVGGPGFMSQRSSYGSSRNWERQDTAPAVEAAKVVLLGDAHYSQATVGITGLHLRLDRPALMLSWDSHLECSNFQNGLLTMLLRMDFVQNHPGMDAARRAARKYKPRPSSRCSIKAHPGAMFWEMEVALLQFEAAKIEAKVVR